MRAKTVRVDRWEKTPTRTAQDKIKIKEDPGRQQPCWGFLFCTNLTQPTGALDSKTSREVLNFLKQLNEEGNTIVMITHDNSIAMEAKRVVRIADGHKIFDGDVKDYAAIL